MAQVEMAADRMFEKAGGAGSGIDRVASIRGPSDLGVPKIGVTRAGAPQVGVAEERLDAGRLATLAASRAPELETGASANSPGREQLSPLRQSGRAAQTELDRSLPVPGKPERAMGWERRGVDGPLVDRGADLDMGLF